jgi:hypothetical protein
MTVLAKFVDYIAVITILSIGLSALFGVTSINRDKSCNNSKAMQHIQTVIESE